MAALPPSTPVAVLSREDLEARYDLMLIQVERKQAELKDLKEQLDEHRKEVNERMEKMGGEIETLKEANSNKIRDNIRKTADLKKLEVENKALKAELDVKDTINKNLHDVIAVKTKGHDNLKELNTRLCQQIQGHQRDKTALEQTIERLTTTVADSASDEVPSNILTTENTRMANELEVAQEGLDTVSRQQTALAEDLQGEGTTAHEVDHRDLGRRLYELTLEAEAEAEAEEEEEEGKREEKGLTYTEAGVQTDPVIIDVDDPCVETEPVIIDIDDKAVQAVKPIKDQKVQTDPVIIPETNSVGIQTEGLFVGREVVSVPRSSLGLLFSWHLVAVLLAIISEYLAAKEKWSVANELSRLSLITMRDETWLVPLFGKWAFSLENLLGIERSLFG